jgi:hypothetical protein
MLKVENIEVSNIKGALRGMRNPMASWDKADSDFSIKITHDESKNYFIETNLYLGDNDKQLAQKLILSGSDHRKFMRQIFFCGDITAPDYWWKEMDTYKIATVANSTSTMHKLTSKELTFEDFSFDEITDYEENTINDLNILIDVYKHLSDDDNSKKKVWRKLIQRLPMSFNYTRTWTASYETLRNIYFARRNHKLSEWHTFCDMIKGLPLGKELITLEKEK